MITQEFNLNMIPDSAPVVVKCDQYDVGAGRLIAHLYNGNVAYTPGQGATAIIQGTKPDKKGFSYSATISGNTVTADLTKQMSIVAGKTRVSIVVTESANRTGTFVFWLDVQESSLPDDTDMSESEYSQIEQAIESVRDSEAWATGKKDGTDVPPTDPTYHNNSKYYSEQTAGIIEAATASAEDSEAWAIGKRNGTPVSSSDPAYHNNAEYWSDEASSSAEDSEAYAIGTRNGSAVTSVDPAYHNNAKYYSEQSASSAGSSDDSAEDSEAWAVGERNGTPVTSGDDTFHNNSKYWAGKAADSETAAESSKTAASGSAQDAEAYAKGTRNGSVVGSSDPAYHNNSKYYSEQAGSSATAAGSSAEDSEAFAKGTRNGSAVGSSDPAYHNNSKYYAESIGSDVQEAHDWAEGPSGTSTTPTDTNNAKYWAQQSQAAAGIVIDNVPTSGSGNLISSGAVYSAIGGKLEKLVSSTVSDDTVSFTDAAITSTAIIDGPYIEDVLIGVEEVETSGTTVTFTLSDDSADGKSAYIWVRTLV